MSGYSEEYIKNKLKESLEAEHVEVVDQSDGCGGKFEAVIVAAQFEGRGLLARHRLVNTALAAKAHNCEISSTAQASTCVETFFT